MKRHLIYLIFILSSTTVLRAGVLHAEGKSKVKWEKISNDLEIAAYNPEADSLFSQELIFIRSNLSKFSAVSIFEKNFKFNYAKDFCLQSGSAVCINSNFFDEDRKPLGLVVKNGIVYNPLHKGGSLLNGILSIKDNKIKIYNRKYFSEPLPEYAVQTGPLLIQNGKVYSKFKSGDTESRRSGACIDYQDRLILFSSSGEVTGPSLNKLVSILLMPGISCRDALNFDGGGSAQLYLNDQYVNIKKYKTTNELAVNNISSAKDPVPVVIALKIK